MVTYGFFNSVYGDRKYDADQMSDFYTGIVTQGVFQHVDNGLEVTAGTGLTVSVNTGRAIIQNKWVKNDTPLVLELAPAPTTYDRFDIVVLKYDSNNRNVQIIVKTGTPVGTPVVPELVREGGIYEMCLAVIDVEAGATSVTVTDTRSDTTVCGWASVAQATSGEVDQMLDDLKTGFNGVEYSSPAAAVRACDTVLNDKILTTIATSNRDLIVSSMLANRSADITSIDRDKIVANFGSDSNYRYYEITGIAAIKVKKYHGYLLLAKAVNYAVGLALDTMKTFTCALNGTGIWIKTTVSLPYSDYYYVEKIDNDNLIITAADGTAATINIPTVTGSSEYNATIGVVDRNSTSHILHYDLFPYKTQSKDFNNAIYTLSSGYLTSDDVEDHTLGISSITNDSIVANFGSDSKYRYYQIDNIASIKAKNFHGYFMIGRTLNYALCFDCNSLKLLTIQLGTGSFWVKNTVDIKANSTFYIFEKLDENNVKITADNGSNATINLPTVLGNNEYRVAFGPVDRNTTSMTFNYELYPLFLRLGDYPIINHYLFNNGDISDSIDVDISGYTDIISNSEIENFVFYTDPHLEENAKKSKLEYYMTFLQKYYNYAPVDFIVCGGDWLGSGDTISQAKEKLGEIFGFTSTMFNENHYNVVGNHDTNYLGQGPGGETYEGELEQATIDGLWFRKQGRAYYSFDGANTTFYVLDTGVIDPAPSLDHRYDDVMNAYRWLQVDWLANKLLTDDKKHSAIFMHIYKDGGVVSQFATNIGSLIEAYNDHNTIVLNEITYDFSNCTGRLEFIMCGHEHADSSAKVDTVPVVITSWFYSAGSSPLFDLVSADYTDRKLYCIRIGAGNNRVYDLDTGELIA